MNQWILVLFWTKTVILLSDSSFMSSQCLKDKVGSTENSFQAVLKHDRHLYRRGVLLPSLIIFITQCTAYKRPCFLSTACADLKYCEMICEDIYQETCRRVLLCFLLIWLKYFKDSWKPFCTRFHMLKNSRSSSGTQVPHSLLVCVTMMRPFLFFPNNEMWITQKMKTILCVDFINVTYRKGSVGKFRLQKWT